MRSRGRQMTSPAIPRTDGWAGFHSILDAVDAPVVVLQRDLTVVFFNEAARDVLHVAEPDIGRASCDIPALAGIPRLEEQCSAVAESGAESRLDFHDGDKWFVVRVAPCTERGNRTGVVLTFSNVTAFRASIDQAIYERECTKAILDAVADPLVVLSDDQRIQSGNRAFYTMLYELASLPRQLEEMLAGARPFQPIEVDHDFPGEGRRTLILDARPLSMPGHSERRVLVSFRDITNQTGADAANDLRAIAERREELRRSEAFLAEAQRLSSTGSFSWRVTADEITWSDQLYRIFELDQGLPVTLELIESRVHPEDIPTFRDMTESARGTGADFAFEHRLQLPDQSVRYVHLVAHGTRDEDGRLEYVGAVQDVTARRLSEQALGKAQSELEQVARVSTLNTLTASIAHEVNQPLSGIITNGSTCLRMLAADPPDVEGACAAARRTIRDGNRAADVIARVRALFTNEQSAMEPVDLNEAAQEVIALSLSELHRHRVVLRTQFAGDLPIVTGERIPLQQVILNLLRNALDAMVAGDDRTRHLLISTERENGDRARVTVRDTGVGLDRTSMDKLFDAFYTTKYDGMGIGLSVSTSIVERHHGRLWAQPNDGPGATFSFSIPSGRESAGGGGTAGRHS
jgi:signal transduction histidine kinase